MVFGGYTTPPGTTRDETEEYDGTSWSEQNDLNNAKDSCMSAGTQTAGLGAGGYLDGSANQAHSEEYDGTSWTEGNNLNTGRYALAGAGLQTAGLAFAGYVHPSPGNQVLTENYDGTSWSEVADMPTAKASLGGAGTNTSAFSAGGDIPTPAIVVTSEEWSGAASVETVAFD